MLSATLQKTRENIRQSYQSRNGTLYIHGLTVNGIEYEYHSKSNGLKFQAGVTIWYDSVQDDGRGNMKIMKPTDKAPQGVAGTTAATPPPVPPVQQQAPNSPVVAGPSANKTEIWLKIFASICMLKAGAGGEGTLNRVVEETDKLAARFA